MIITIHRLYARRHVDVHSYLATNIVATIALYFSYYYLYYYQNHYYHFYHLFLVSWHVCTVFRHLRLRTEE